MRAGHVPSGPRRAGDCALDWAFEAGRPGTVKLYLVRHGDAVSANLDLTRPLSETGEAQAAALAAFLAGQGARVARVCALGGTWRFPKNSTQV